MGEPAQCRDLGQLSPMCESLVSIALEKIKAAGVNPLVVETYRSQERQNYLYSLGRSRAGNKVTWTLNSVHTKRNAVDLIAQYKKNGKMVADWNENSAANKLIQSVMKGLGFEWGGDWTSTKDYPHFQLKGISEKSKSFSKSNTNAFITKAVQTALNSKLKAEIKGKKMTKLVADGGWGAKTTAAVNLWRKKCKYSQTGKIGTIAIKKLFK